jgi:hypothetical protein
MVYVCVLTFFFIGIEAIGAQVRLDCRTFSPQYSGDPTDNVTLQLEDPFGYDKADIKVDAIVEDLRVSLLRLSHLRHIRSRAYGMLSSPRKALNQFSSQQVETSVLIAEWRRTSDMFTG